MRAFTYRSWQSRCCEVAQWLGRSLAGGRHYSTTASRSRHHTSLPWGTWAYTADLSWTRPLFVQSSPKEGRPDTLSRRHSRRWVSRRHAQWNVETSSLSKEVRRSQAIVLQLWYWMCPIGCQTGCPFLRYYMYTWVCGGYDQITGRGPQVSKFAGHSTASYGVFRGAVCWTTSEPSPLCSSQRSQRTSRAHQSVRPQQRREESEWRTAIARSHACGGIKTNR